MKLAELAEQLGVAEDDFDSLIPKDTRWRLILDKDVQGDGDQYYLDKKNVYGETGYSEPGYYAAMSRAIDYCIANRNEEVTIDLLIKLFSEAILDVKKVRVPEVISMCQSFFQSEPVCESVPFMPARETEYTEYILPPSFFPSGSYPLNSPVGKDQPMPPFSAAVLGEWEKEHLIYDLRRNDEPNPWAAGYLACYRSNDQPSSEVRKRLPELPMTIFKDEEEFLLCIDRNVIDDYNFRAKEGFDSYIDTRKREFMDFLISHDKHGRDKIISSLGVPLPHYSDPFRFARLNRKQVEPKLEEIIGQYKASIEQSKNDEGKLLAIVRLVRALEVAHPFPDGNQRTFVFLLLNKLLLQHGFTPVILNNPVVFDGFLSAQELVDEIKIGFGNFLEVVHPGVSLSNAFDDAPAQGPSM